MNNYIYARGQCEPGYESVKDMFEQQIRDEVHEYCQLCVYVKGKKVIDLHGSRPRKPSRHLKYDETSVQNIFSSTKVLTSLVVAMLVDRGQLKYEERVVDIWPEYGQNNKKKTTVAEVMRHEAGIPNFDVSIAATDLYAEAIRNGSVSDLIAGQKPIYTPGTKFRYHALTRGWIVNEIVRRVDVKGRTIGEFLREEVAIPLNLDKELYIGIPSDEHHRIAPLNADLQNDYMFNLKNLALPRFLGGGRVPMNSFGMRLMFVLGLSVYSVGFSLKNIMSVLSYLGLDASSRSDDDNDVKGDKAPARSTQGIHVVEDSSSENKKKGNNFNNVFNHAQVRMGET